MTKQKAIRNHRRLWKWLAKNPKKYKWDWPEWKYKGGDIEEIDCDCFLCELAGLRKNGTHMCQNCIGDWKLQSNLKTCHKGEKGLFVIWDNTENVNERTELALKIRDVVKE